MQLKNILILLYFTWISSGFLVFSHSNPPTKEAIDQIAKKANKLMKEGSYEKSLILSRVALSQALLIKDDNLIATSYNTIAANFDQLSEAEKAFYYYKKGLKYANKTNNDVLKHYINNNLGNIYCFDKKEYEKGIYHYKKSLRYSTRIKDSAQIVFTKLNLTWAYFDVGNFNEGLPYLKYINKFHTKHGDSSTSVVLNMLNGMYYSYTNDNTKANFFFEKAIRLGNDGLEKSDLSFSYNEYSKFLMKTGKYEAAYQNLALYNTITNELDLEEKLNKANVAGINLQIDEYKREIDKIGTDFKNKEHELLQEQYRNKKIVIVVVVILLLLSFVFYISTQNAKLKHKNKLKDLQSKVQENIINASINGQELERKKIAGFLHDNISALLSSAGMQLQAFSNQNKISSPELNKTKSILEDAHDQIRDLSHELMPSLLARFGLFESLDALCEKNSNCLIHFTFSNSTAKGTRYDEDFEMKIYFIIMELLNNIIKHSEATESTLMVNEEKQSLCVTLTDNGKGFDSSNFHVLEGFGINQIKARINNLKGTITIDSKLQLGTTVMLQIPISYHKKGSTRVFPSQ